MTLPHLELRRIICVAEYITMKKDFRLGKWLVCPELKTVQSEGPPVRIEHKCMQVLVCLARRPGEVVTKEELMRGVWADTFVTDDVLTRAVSELRRVLGDDAKQPHIIETISRGGYRIIASVDAAEVNGPLAGVGKTSARARQRKWLAVAAATIVAITLWAAVLLLRQPAALVGASRSIAVVPLQNLTASKEYDFLRVGLADEIATTLSYYPTLSIRPFVTTNRYADSVFDLQKAAREMRVADIITGHFSVTGDKIEISLEAVDAGSNSVVWTDTLRGTTQDLTGIQQQIAVRVQRGLVTALGVNAGAGAFRNTSHSPEAYELYLRALSARNSATPESPLLFSNNEEAIRLLNRAVTLDPSFASAWAALGHLYYYESGDDKTTRLMAKAALQRAVALDENRLDAASDLINIESEEGELNRAYDDISGLLRRRPDSGSVRLVYAYVLWYGGLLEEAATECEKTRSIDAGTTDLASCGYVFMALGRYERAKEYLRLVSGSQYQKEGEVELLLREGKLEEALRSLEALPPTAFTGREVLEPCISRNPRAPAIAPMAAQRVRAKLMMEDDPLPKYMLAAWDSLCGQTEAANATLRRAIEQNYCAYPQMETDPLMENLRKTAGFGELRSLGIACQKKFLEHRKQRHAE